MKKSAQLGGSGVRRLTHAKQKMMIAMLAVVAPKVFTVSSLTTKMSFGNQQRPTLWTNCG
jgi:hypothetical protein